MAEPYDTPDVRPVPDPTLLTTQQLMRELALLRAELDTKVSHLKELCGEKFRHIEAQFIERDVRGDQRKEENRRALEAALASSRELMGEQRKGSEMAIDKSEKATAGQIQQLGTMFDKNSQSQDAKIDDLKQRLALIEGRSSGLATGWSYLIAAIGLAGAVVGLVVMLTK